MTAITATQAQAHLDAWLAADEKVASGQAYTIGNRALTRADAAEIRENITFWDRKVERLARAEGTGMPVKGATLA